MSKVFDLVLGIFREPGQVADLRDKELPESLSLVIRLAAGEGAALQCALDTTGETAETLVDASVFFLQQVLFAPGADAYRVLGADSDAPQERLRDNYRWLMKWLHPDRNQDGWEAVYADRVNVAWQDLKTPDRRAEYDRRSPSTQMLAPMTPASMRRIVPVAPAPGGPLLSGSTVRRLPALVLGTLGMAAMAMIGITYWAQSATQRELAELQRDRDAPVDALSARPHPGLPEAPIVTDAPAASSAAAASVRADLDAIDVVFADVAPLASVPETPADVPAIADVPVISAVPVSTGEKPEVLAAAEPALVAAAAAPAAVSMQLPTAAEPAAVSMQLPTAAAPAAVSMQLPTAAAPAAVSTQLPTAAAPAAPMAAVREQTPVEVDIPAATGEAATGVEPAVAAAAPAKSFPRAPKSIIAIAADPPVPAAPPPQPAPRVVPDSPPVATAKVVSQPPAPTTAAVAPPPPRPAPEQHDAEALVHEFASAYAAGDLARFDRLFTRASPEVAALIPMRSRFGSTEMRYLEIRQIGWHAEQEQGRVRARYRDTYVPRGGRKAVTESGVIEWTIRVDAGDARIASVARNDGGT